MLFLGPVRAVSCLHRLLKSVETNPLATMITLYMNAVAGASMIWPDEADEKKA